MIIPKADLTPSGRPRLAPGEIERALLDKVGRWHVVVQELQHMHTCCGRCCGLQAVLISYESLGVLTMCVLMTAGPNRNIAEHVVRAVMAATTGFDDCAQARA